MKTLRIYSKKIQSDINNVGSAVKDVIDYLHSIYSSLDECMLFEIKVILNELILNAVRHGNKEDDKKFVKISTGIKNGTNLFIIIEDSGEGHDYKNILEKSAHTDSAEDICNLKETGRGILIVRNLCDKIKYNKRGNKVLVMKNLDKKH